MVKKRGAKKNKKEPFNTIVKGPKRGGSLFFVLLSFAFIIIIGMTYPESCVIVKKNILGDL
jgi:hypothetical protein